MILQKLPYACVELHLTNGTKRQFIAFYIRVLLIERITLHFVETKQENSPRKCPVMQMIVDAGYAVAVYQHGAEENNITQTFVPGECCSVRVSVL